MFTKKNQFLLFFNTISSAGGGNQNNVLIVGAIYNVAEGQIKILKHYLMNVINRSMFICVKCTFCSLNYAFNKETNY